LPGILLLEPEHDCLFAQAISDVDGIAEALAWLIASENVSYCFDTIVQPSNAAWFVRSIFNTTLRSYWASCPLALNSVACLASNLMRCQF